MEKRLNSQKKTNVKKAESQVSKDKIAKIKAAIKGVDWKYDGMSEELNGFIETHEQNSNKLKKVELEKLNIQNELAKSDQKLQFVSQRLQETQNEIAYVKKGYQLRVDELLSAKNELTKNLEILNQKKNSREEKLKELHGILKAKEDNLVKALNQLSEKDVELKNLNTEYNQKLQSYKKQMSEKAEEKLNLISAKNNQIKAEKEQLQIYVSELMSDKGRIHLEVKQLKDKISEMAKQKEELAKEVANLHRNLEDQDKTIQAFEAKKKVSEKIMASLNTELSQRSDEIKKLNYNIEDLQNSKVELEEKLFEQSKVFQVVAQLKQDIAGFMDSIATLEDEKNKLLDKQRQLDSEIEFLNKENRVWAERYDGLIQDHENNIDKLKLQKVELQQSFDSVSKELGELKLVLQDKNEDLVFQNQNLKNLETQVQLKEDNLEKLQKEAYELTDERNSLNLQLRDANENIQKLQRDLDHKNENNEVLNSQLGELTEQVTAYLTELAYKENQIETLKMQTKSQTEDLQNLKDKLRSEINFKEQTLEQLSEIQNNYKIESQKNDKLSADLEYTSKQIQNLEIEKSNLQTDVFTLNAKTHRLLEQMESQKNDFSAQVEAEVLRGDKLTKDLEASQNKVVDLENQKITLELEIVELNDKMTVSQSDIKAQAAQLQEQIAELKVQHAQDNEILKSQYEQDIKNLEAQHKQKLEAIQADNNQMIESIVNENAARLESIQTEHASEIQTANAAISEAQTHLASKMDLIKSLEVKITEFELSESLLDQKNRELQEQINTLQEQHIVFEDNLESFEEKVSALNIEKNKLQLEIIENKKTLSLYSQTIDDLNIKLENEVTSANELKIELIEKESEILQKQSMIDDLITDKTSAHEQIKNFKSEIFEMQKNHDALQMEKVIVEDQNQQLQTEVLNLELSLQELQEQSEKLALDKKAEAEKLNQVIKTHLDDKELYFIEKQELTKTITSLEHQSRDLSLKMLQSVEKFENVFSQKQNLENQIDASKELHNLVKKRNQELDTVFANLMKREEQLSLYSRWVDSQKEGLQRQVLKIAAELRATKEFNPLNPYLKMTEKEISKVEVLLTKSNVFGPQRAQLENQYEQLVKQRDEVRELLVRTNNEVDHKAQTLISTLKSSEFIPVPPLPPGEVDKGETDLQLN